MEYKKNEIIIFDIFLDSDHKINIFKQTLNSVKKLNLPIMVISNFDVPNYLISQFDYFIYSKENLLFTDSYDEYDKSHVSFNHNSKEINFRYEKMFDLKQVYGLSVLSNIHKCTTLAEKLGYKKYIRIEWDFVIIENEYEIIKKMIDDFTTQNKQYFFIYDRAFPNLFYCHFWMVDLKFWNDNFPYFNDENDYKKYLYDKTKKNHFLGAEQILYLAFQDKVNKKNCMEESVFLNLFKKSRVNTVVNDKNFQMPSSNNICRGLGIVIRNKNVTGELCLFTWNRTDNLLDDKKYIISNHNTKIEIEHSVEKNGWRYNILKLRIADLPIKLNMNGSFTKIYNSISEIDSFLIFE